MSSVVDVADIISDSVRDFLVSGGWRCMGVKEIAVPPWIHASRRRALVYFSKPGMKLYAAQLTELGQHIFWVKYKSEHSGWSTRKGPKLRYISKDNLEKDLGDLNEIDLGSSSVITKESLPVPFSFVSSVGHDNAGFVVRRSTIAECKCLGAVGLDSLGRTSKKQSAYPGEEVWFEFKCYAYNSASFEVLYRDGVFYPLNNGRIATVFKKASVKVDNFSDIDEDLLKVAIEEFLKK